MWARRAGRGVGGAAVRVPASCAGAARVGVAEVLGVALPADVRGVQLVEQRRHARRVDAAVGAGRRVGPAADASWP